MQMRHIQHACIDKCSLYLFLQLIQGEKCFETCNLKSQYLQGQRHILCLFKINVLTIGIPVVITPHDSMAFHNLVRRESQPDVKKMWKI